MTEATGSLPRRGLKRVKISGLFGRYNYDLVPDSGELEAIAILYGDNGCGKTTILALLFHLLSAANDRGHRNAIARVPFRSVSIELHDESVIRANRDEGSNIGAYNIYVKSPTQGAVQVRFDPETDPKYQPRENERAYLDFLEALNLSLFFVSADRETLSDGWAASDPEEEAMEMRYYRHSRPGRGDRLFQQLRRRSLELAITNANNWIARQSVSGTNLGAGSANEIYEQIVRGIVDAPAAVGADSTVNPNEIAKTLVELAERNEDFAKFEMTSQLKVSTLVADLQSSEGDTQSIVSRVLEPYIEGTRARLDALQDVQRLTEAFVRNFNEFFVDKRVDFTLSSGLQIFATTGEALEPGLLSSGEQRLLRIFCNTIVSRDRASIFIVDEPELSLNVKWQRKLIGALSELVEGSEMQFVFATHSLEFLAQHRQRVVRLSSSD